MSRLDGTQSGKKIWALTWPQILMFLCQFAIGITDVWACGRLGANVQAAMGLVAQCQFFLMILAFAGTSGTIASISQSLGAARADKARRYAWLSVGFGFAAASGLSLAAAGFDREILKLINTPPDIAEQAAGFFRPPVSAYLFPFLLKNRSKSIVRFRPPKEDRCDE